MELFSFFWQLSFFTWFSGAVFFGLAATALSIWLGLGIRLSIILGLVFQWLGILALVVIHLVKTSNRKPISPQENHQDDWAMPSNAGANGIDSAGSMFSERTPYEFVSYDKSYDDSGRRYWITKIPGLIIFLGVVLVAVALVLSLFMTWFNVVSERNEFLEINAMSTGLDFWIFVSLAVIIGSILLSVKGPSIVAAVLLAWVGSWWLMLSMASLTARDVFVPAVDKLFQIPNLVIEANTRDGSISTAYAFDVGVAWYVIFACALLLVSSSAWLLNLAHSDKKQVDY